MALNSENLTYWYFRLNGFFTIPNFVVHPDQGIAPRTEIDVLGVRLPHRRELLENPMEDDPLFTNVGHKSYLAIVEVKQATIGFNATWRDSSRKNVQRVLAAAGAFPSNRIASVADEIYAHGRCAGEANCYASLIGIGAATNTSLRNELPDVPQITWLHIASFIFKRFSKYRDQKRFHYQWDDEGQELWELWKQHAGEHDKFQQAIVELIAS